MTAPEIVSIIQAVGGVLFALVIVIGAIVLARECLRLFFGE